MTADNIRLQVRRLSVDLLRIETDVFVPSAERPNNRALQKPSTLYIWYFSFEQSRAIQYVKGMVFTSDEL